MKLSNFTLEKYIGKGAFGEVYLTSKEGDTKKKYATKKIVRDEFEKDEGTKKYLSNEIVVLQNLIHPNIIKFEEVKKSKMYYYIIMEYCNGGTLSEALEKYIKKNSKPFSEEIVRYLMRQIIDGFKFIHSRNIVHQDVKIYNILLNYENEEDKQELNLMKAQVKITDFGLAILQKIYEETKTLIHDDIWCIGNICYELLIGKSPFDSKNVEEITYILQNENFYFPKNLSNEAVSFLKGMLQIEEKNRLTFEKLSKHDFLTKNVESFKILDLKNDNEQK